MYEAVFLITSIVFLFGIRCRERDVFQVSFAGDGPTQKPVRISFFDLMNDVGKCDGKLIETSGFFSNGFEDFAIYSNRYRTSGNRGFWLSLHPELKISEEAHEKLNGKKITIRGIVDISNKGHLSSYVATIKGIYHVSYN